jgi:hypothetical protein
MWLNEGDYYPKQLRLSLRQSNLLGVKVAGMG